MADAHPFLFQGATGPAVEECQRRLTALGFYKGPISGTYSPDTAGAAVKLQQQEKLSPVNGGFYKECWDALDRLEAKAKPPPPPPQQKSPPPPPPPKQKSPPPPPPKQKSPPPPPPPQQKPLPPPKQKSPPPPPPQKQQPPPPPPRPKSTPPGSPTHPFLFQSANGPAVKDLQERLSKLGLYKGAISGIYSPGTAAAVVALQRKARLSRIDGGMQDVDWAALEQLEKAGASGPSQPGGSKSGSTSPSTSHPALHYGSEGQEVTALQQRLAKLGLSPGVADGVYGAYTSLAVSALQKEAEVQATGAMDEATWSALERFEKDPPEKKDGPDPSTTGPSGPIKVHPPTSARLKNPAWDSLVYKDGANAVLCCDAPQLEGHRVTFFVQQSTDRLKWTDFKQVPAQVSGGRARASVPVQSQGKQQVHLRFRVDLG